MYQRFWTSKFISKEYIKPSLYINGWFNWKTYFSRGSRWDLYQYQNNIEEHRSWLECITFVTENILYTRAELVYVYRSTIQGTILRSKLMNQLFWCITAELHQVCRLNMLKVGKTFPPWQVWKVWFVASLSKRGHTCCWGDTWPDGGD